MNFGSDKMLIGSVLLLFANVYNLCLPRVT